MVQKHSFHIPVMGIGFTADTPAKVAHLGIDSVISLVDDELLEKLRKVYSTKFKIPFIEIKKSNEDFRAKRITSYLNLIQKIVIEKFDQLKKTKNEELSYYLSLLPNGQELLKEFQNTIKNTDKKTIYSWLDNKLSLGNIDVNIMTKVDKENYKDDKKLDIIYNDAHAALRGFANSNLKSSVVLSAGMNPKLYGYIEEFNDFYPDENGVLKKKIILKVSDYRSAIIQGKFLAKKGIWVSEYRIESGLNCGGHAFATDGFLLGPVLEEFKNSKEELITTLDSIYKKALVNKGKNVPLTPLAIKLSAQGGVGTAEEHLFLQKQYNIDSVGWGSPFLLVPEATTVDDETRERLEKAKEKDLYLSNISPLGIPFNNLKGNTKDIEKELNIKKGRPGSACPKKFISLNKEFKEEGLCTASRQYQYLKLKELEEKDILGTEFDREFKKITDKSCICVGLGSSALIKYNLDTKKEGTGISVCPGPNMAYFSKTIKLQEMVKHIYSKGNIINKDRPNMFLKELSIYINYLSNQLKEGANSTDKKQNKYFKKFIKNMIDGVDYYLHLFKINHNFFKTNNATIYKELIKHKQQLLSYSKVYF